jgi:hypothetical protein
MEMEGTQIPELPPQDQPDPDEGYSIILKCSCCQEVVTLPNDAPMFQRTNSPNFQPLIALKVWCQHSLGVSSACFGETVSVWSPCINLSKGSQEHKETHIALRNMKDKMIQPNQNVWELPFETDLITQRSFR